MQCFWYTWCKNCIIQLEKMQKYAKNRKSRLPWQRGCRKKNICIFVHHLTEVKNMQSFRKIYFFYFQPILTVECLYINIKGSLWRHWTWHLSDYIKFGQVTYFGEKQNYLVSSFWSGHHCYHGNEGPFSASCQQNCF